MDKPTQPAQPTQPIAAFHVFRAGTHTTAHGEKIEFTQADVAQIAAAYDPALHEAPIVIGHPTMDAPAYGWAAKFEAKGGDLYAVGNQVNPEFAQMVADGAYKKRSLKLYRPTDPLNPKPGAWYPQHIGFLGATPPAIQGLKEVQFAQNDTLVEVEFSSYSDSTVARLLRSLRDWLIADRGLATADQVLPAWDVDALSSEATRETIAANAVEGGLAGLPAMFTQQAKPQPQPQETNQVDKDQAAAIQADNDAMRRQLNERDAKDRQAASVQFCEKLIGEGKVLPAEKDAVVGLLNLAAVSQPVQFGEGDGSETAAPLGKLQGLLEALPKRVEFGEVAGAAKGDMTDAKPVQFSAPGSYGVDGDRLDLHNRALAYQAQHAGTDYVTAVKAVS